MAKSSVKKIRELVDEMIKQTPESAKKNGSTVITRNGKKYSYSYTSNKKK